jgi:uncharacterized protein (DUF885 family)
VTAGQPGLDEPHGLDQQRGLDQQFEALVSRRFDALMERFPVYASYLGLHAHDGRLGDGSRDRVLNDTVEARRFIGQLEALDPLRLTATNQIERELALFATRRQVFDDEVHRLWERRASATDEIGDGIFVLFARASRPLSDVVPLIASRLEAAPRLLDEYRGRLGDEPVRLWNEIELDAAGSLPSLFAEVSGAARSALGDGHAEVRRLDAAVSMANEELTAYSDWLRQLIARSTDDFALGREHYDELVGLRAFDGLTTDDILEIGEQQLATNRQARRSVAADIDGNATEQEVIDRVKSDHPADFETALDAYRRAMAEARGFLLEHNIVSLPDGESLAVVPTPEYLRNVLPFAAYFGPAKFDPATGGIYLVTPATGGEVAQALSEHNHASIYNTSIHEAYPGHHVQLTSANGHPSLVRLMIDAPEFVEGWAMYCEQMMRDEGFDTSPEHRLAMYTDAIWRACRIILDVRLHRGELSVEQATDFLSDQTSFSRAKAAAEVNRYTYTPTYQLSYLLGKVLLLRLRDSERSRLGSRFSLKGFHDALLRQGSLPVSFQRRLLAQDGG